uniref:Uncharacterized protein n=1 Tax=Ditylenchus dipsaci TaxID=166011 RepID=A0A915DF83_9BILA
MELETNEDDQCVGKSNGDHTHGTSKAEIEIRKLLSQTPELADREIACDLGDAPKNFSPPPLFEKTDHPVQAENNRRREKFSMYVWMMA